MAFNDIQTDYYQIPHDDKDRLKKDEEKLRIELKEKSNNVEEVEKDSNTQQAEALVAESSVNKDKADENLNS